MNPATQMSQEQNRSQQLPEDGSGNVDKIRDILFGTHIRDYESRFKRLEENLVRESAEIREMTRQRLDALEEYIKKEFESQTQRLKSERDERTANVEQQERELRDLSQNLSRRLTEANDLAAETSRSIRAEILSRSNSLLQELQNRHQEASTTLDRHVSELKDAKTDRATLAGLLNEMAMRLTGEFKLPAPNSSPAPGGEKNS
jgi:uncharacterized protein YaaN involved in tellurite resistance